MRRRHESRVAWASENEQKETLRYATRRSFAVHPSNITLVRSVVCDLHKDFRVKREIAPTLCVPDCKAFAICGRGVNGSSRGPVDFKLDS